VNKVKPQPETTLPAEIPLWPLALPGAVRAAANAGVLGLWLWLYRPMYAYLAIIFSRDDFRTNQLVLLGALALIALRTYRKRPCLQIDAAPRLAALPLALALGGSALYLVVERYLDVNTLSACLFGLASYGLLGLWMRPRPWRQGLPAALLVIGALPFGEHLQTFIGYPMRLLTARIVQDGLAAVGAGSIGIDTILVFENGVSQVDLPCSGVKSLWTGMLYLIAATWIERRPLNLRWSLVALIFSGLLLAANIARVAILIAVGQVAGWRLAAQMIHVPLGALAFVAACAAALALMRRQPPMLEESEPPAQAPLSGAVRAASPDHPIWLAPVLMVAILAMAIGYAPRPQTGLARPPLWVFPTGLATTQVPLATDEIGWLTRDGAESADRRRFAWRGITGSMILIPSTSWRAHHRPERCFEVYGLSIDDSRTHLVDPAFPVRFVSLGDSRGQGLLSATYWFQSARLTTDDYGTRIWADLAPRRDRWVMVSILFDGVYDPRSPDVQALYLALRDAVAHNLGGGLS
jgi:exosortase O